MTKRKTKQPAGVVCHDGKRCKGTHPLICRDHGCGILVGRAAAAESKALATKAERVRSSAWVAELEAALAHVKKAKEACRQREAWADWNECARTEKDLEYIIETQRRRSATAKLCEPRQEGHDVR